jgi:hypothetical protein
MITGEQGARKPASPVREETDGKRPGQGHLAGGRLHSAGRTGETHQEQSRQGAPVRPNPGVWHVAENDPDSGLYAESSDADTVIQYMTANS